MKVAQAFFARDSWDGREVQADHCVCVFEVSASLVSVLADQAACWAFFVGDAAGGFDSYVACASPAHCSVWQRLT